MARKKAKQELRGLSALQNDKEKQEEELRTLSTMVKLYCRGNHAESLCDECRELIHYAAKRIENCPFKETKSFCSECNVHCYRPEMRERVRQVMRYSGPRMIFHNPTMALRHAFTKVRSRWGK